MRAAQEETQKLLPPNPTIATTARSTRRPASASGEHEQAIALYRELLDRAPQPADLHLSIAHSLKTLGRRKEAIEPTAPRPRRAPSFGDAYWSLANLKTYRFADDEMAQMRAARQPRPTAPVDRYHLCFALGKALEDRGRVRGVLAFYERGNALKRADSRYRPESSSATRACRSRSARASSSRAREGSGLPEPAIRSSSSGCRAPAPR